VTLARSPVHYGWLIVMLVILLVSSSVVSLAFGPASVPLTHVIGIVAQQLGIDWGPALSKSQVHIVWLIRAPRVLLGALVGAGLALVGTALQSVTRNPLADPHLLGVSAGASTGAVLVALMGVGGGLVSLSAGAFVGAMAAFALVILLARASGSSSGTGQIILAGIAGSQLFNALTAYLITKSASSEQARGILFWLLGNLSGVRWPSVWLAVPVALLGLAVCLWHRRALDAFTFGSDSAASLGIPVRRVQVVLVGCAALVTAVMVSIVGSIGFVGLVIPHAGRLLLGTGHSRLLPASALGGALFLIAADVLSRTLIKGQVIPVGVVTALVGAPVFALILIGRRNAR